MKLIYWITWHKYYTPLPDHVPTFNASAADAAFAKEAAHELSPPSEPLMLSPASNTTLHVLKPVAKEGDIVWTMNTTLSQAMVITALCLRSDFDHTKYLTICFDAPISIPNSTSPGELCADPAMAILAEKLFGLSSPPASYAQMIGATRGDGQPCHAEGDDPLVTWLWLTLPMPFAHNATLQLPGAKEVRVRTQPLPAGLPATGFGHLRVKLATQYPRMYDLATLVDIPHGQGNYVGLYLALANAFLGVQEGDQFMTWDGAMSPQVSLGRG